MKEKISILIKSIQVIKGLKETIDSLYAVVCESEKAVQQLSRNNADMMNSSTKKRRKSDINTVLDDFTLQDNSKEKTQDVMAVAEAPQRTFGNAFAVPRDPFVPTDLGTTSLQDFLVLQESRNS
jgi:hypothetical protein